MDLETLRDDLAIYLKILQSAMIELINKDYADFVNLSTNLVLYLWFEHTIAVRSATRFIATIELCYVLSHY